MPEQIAGKQVSRSMKPQWQVMPAMVAICQGRMIANYVIMAKAVAHSPHASGGGNVLGQNDL
jgi:hypothetical protein